MHFVFFNTHTFLRHLAPDYNGAKHEFVDKFNKFNVENIYAVIFCLVSTF